MNRFAFPLLVSGLLLSPSVAAASCPACAAAPSPLFGVVTWFAGLILWIIVAALALGVLGFVFWVLMLADCAKRRFEQQAVWLVALIASIFFGVHWLIALIYFLVVRYPLGPVSSSADVAKPVPPAVENQKRTDV